MFLACVPRRAMMASLTEPVTESAGARWMASMTAQRSCRDPCLVTCPRVTLTSDSRCRGVSPAHEHSCAGGLEPGHLADLGEKRVHPHGLRHTHAAEFVREGVPINVIRDQLGHASLA